MWKHSKLLLSILAYILEVNFEYQYNKQDVYPLDSNISLIHLIEFKNLKFFLAPIETITWVFIGPVQIMFY